MIFLPIWKRSSSIKTIAILIIAGAECLFGQTSIVTNSIPSLNDSWPTYNGDYSGRRYSTLTQINKSNVKSLKLAWAYQTHAATLKSTPLEMHGIVYFTVPDRVWALDAKTGQQIWEFRRTSEGDHTGQRGVAFYSDRIYFGTPDAHLLCLDARNGKKLWDVKIADTNLGYYLSIAPLIVKGFVVVGTSDDIIAVRHFIEALDWKTGKVVWRTSTLAEPGTPAAKTWPNNRAMNHGGGSAWITGTYDPDLNLIYWGTGNPHPVLAGAGRAGDNLYTCSILALNAATGAIVWSFQTSPHDTHDWDSVETPVLFNAKFNGRPRKLLAQASRNGYFFVLDRQTGEHLLTSPYVPTNWAKGVDYKGSPIPNPAKEPQPDGLLLRGAQGGGTNWMSPSFDPETGLFYVNARKGYSLWHLDADAKSPPEDNHGGGSIALFTTSILLALDYRTGEIRWQRESGLGLGYPGILTTAGHLLFTGDISGNLLALDPSNGHVLWHTRPGGMLNSAPMTYQLNGTQYILTGIDGVLYAWSLSGSL